MLRLRVCEPIRKIYSISFLSLVVVDLNWELTRMHLRFFIEWFDWLQRRAKKVELLVELSENGFFVVIEPKKKLRPGWLHLHNCPNHKYYSKNCKRWWHLNCKKLGDVRIAPMLKSCHNANWVFLGGGGSWEFWLVLIENWLTWGMDEKYFCRVFKIVLGEGC